MSEVIARNTEQPRLVVEHPVEIARGVAQIEQMKDHAGIQDRRCGCPS